MGSMCCDIRARDFEVLKAEFAGPLTNLLAQLQPLFGRLRGRWLYFDALHGDDSAIVLGQAPVRKGKQPMMITPPMTVFLPDEAATLSLGQQLAASLAAGGVVYLRGD